MNTPDLSNARWRRKSKHSSGQGACVEVAALSDAVAALDTKSPDGPVLVFTDEGWTRFTRAVKANKFRP
jgi:hypothetical protein